MNIAICPKCQHQKSEKCALPHGIPLEQFARFGIEDRTALYTKEELEALTHETQKGVVSVCCYFKVKL